MIATLIDLYIYINVFLAGAAFQHFADEPKAKQIGIIALFIVTGLPMLVGQLVIELTRDWWETSKLYFFFKMYVLHKYDSLTEKQLRWMNDYHEEIKNNNTPMAILYRWQARQINKRHAKLQKRKAFPVSTEAA